jgi:UDPglucose 6-dehydrogenase
VSVKNSPSLATLAQMGHVRLALHDPQVDAAAAEHAKARGAASALDALAGADALMILTPWPEYRDVDPAAIAGAMTGRIVIDPYRVLDACEAARAGLRYHALGMPPVA